eukprot:1187200-Prorocentrum_minimum.AAC.4
MRTTNLLTHLSVFIIFIITRRLGIRCEFANRVRCTCLAGVVIHSECESGALCQPHLPPRDFDEQPETSGAAHGGLHGVSDVHRIKSVRHLPVPATRILHQPLAERKRSQIQGNSIFFPLKGIFLPLKWSHYGDGGSGGMPWASRRKGIPRDGGSGGTSPRTSRSVAMPRPASATVSGQTRWKQRTNGVREGGIYPWIGPMEFTFVQFWPRSELEFIVTLPLSGLGWRGGRRGGASGCVRCGGGRRGGALRRVGWGGGGFSGPARGLGPEHDRPSLNRSARRS